MAPPAPGRFTTMTLVPSCLAMPSASRRAVTSADDPAGNSTVISIVPRPGNGSWARAVVTAPTRTATANIASLVGARMRDLSEFSNGDLKLCRICAGTAGWTRTTDLLIHSDGADLV